MTVEEAEDKAYQAIDMGLIKESQFDEYVQYLLKKHGNNPE